MDKGIFQLLKTEFVNNTVESGKFVCPDASQIEKTRSIPGNIYIAGRSQEEDEYEIIWENEFVERTRTSPGNIAIRGICGCEVEEDHCSMI